MTFIGFLAEKKEEGYFEKVVKNTLIQLGMKAMVMAINEKNIENVKNIHFEMILMNRNIEEKCIQDLKELLTNVHYLIVNNDIVHMEKIQNMNLTVITYGFGSKCTMTASSVDEENRLFCLQRSVESLYGKRIEAQEIKSSLPEKIGNQYLKMGIAAMELLYQK